MLTELDFYLGPAISDLEMNTGNCTQSVPDFLNLEIALWSAPQNETRKSGTLSNALSPRFPRFPSVPDFR